MSETHNVWQNPRGYHDVRAAVQKSRVAYDIPSLKELLCWKGILYASASSNDSNVATSLINMRIASYVSIRIRTYIKH